jgi:hypothetical protein
VREGALVLCPNVTLCEQVVTAANSLLGPDGDPLVKTSLVSAVAPPPFHPPDITVHIVHRGGVASIG